MMTNDDQQYTDLLALEDLESLLEELLEAGARDTLDALTLPEGLSDRVIELDVHSLDDLLSRIAELHSKLDSEEPG